MYDKSAIIHPLPKEENHQAFKESEVPVFLEVSVYENKDQEKMSAKFKNRIFPRNFVDVCLILLLILFAGGIFLSHFNLTPGFVKVELEEDQIKELREPLWSEKKAGISDLIPPREIFFDQPVDDIQLIDTEILEPTPLQEIEYTAQPDQDSTTILESTLPQGTSGQPNHDSKPENGTKIPEPIPSQDTLQSLALAEGTSGPPNNASKPENGTKIPEPIPSQDTQSFVSAEGTSGQLNLDSKPENDTNIPEPIPSQDTLQSLASGGGLVGMLGNTSDIDIMDGIPPELNTLNQNNKGPVSLSQMSLPMDLFSGASCIKKPFTCPHPWITFYLYTNGTQTNPEILNVTNEQSLTASKFNPENPTKIIIHGLRQSRNTPGIVDLIKAYFQKGNFNLVVVDYTQIASGICISQVEWYPAFVGKCASQAVSYLSNHHSKGVRPPQMHVIAFSLGVQIAQSMCNHLNESKFGRLTALDPVSFFHAPPPENRTEGLDYTDAHFVDVIHTSDEMFGQWVPSGHIDFYVNPDVTQPACKNDTASFFDAIWCSHSMALQYFTESINTNKGFWAEPCRNSFFFYKGWCTKPVANHIQMGEFVPQTARGIYYVKTNAKGPFAQGILKEKTDLVSSMIGTYLSKL